MVGFVLWVLFGFILCVISMFYCADEWEDTNTLWELFWHTVLLSLWWPVLLFFMVNVRIGFLNRPRKFWFHKKVDK